VNDPAVPPDKAIDRATVIRRLGLTVLTLVIAAIGGSAFTLLTLPAGWLTGAMVAVAAAATAGVRVVYPTRLRNVIFVLLGSSLGAGVSPELIGHVGDWPLTMAIVLVNVAAVQLACQFFLSRVAGWDRQTAFFAAVPGVTSYVLALALPTGANIPRIALSQTVRLFLLVGLAPSVLAALEGAISTSRPIGGVDDFALTLIAGTVGGLIFRFVGVPAAPMIGAMVASGIVHGAGLASGYFPQPLQIGLFVALGALIGSRFAGTTFATLRGTLAASLGSFAVAITVAGLSAWLTVAFTGQSFGEVALAFAPGGIDVMTTMAFALHLDSTFVAAHQLARFFVIAVYAPVFARSPRKTNRADSARGGRPPAP